MKRTRHDERGAALVEAAVTIPILLLIAVGIFEFGRAYQTWQVVTNAAREGARVAVLPGTPQDAVIERVRTYMRNGLLTEADSAGVSVQPTSIDINGTPYSASQVIVSYPFDFMVLSGVARMVTPGSRLGEPLTMQASSIMRNESPF